MLIQKILVAIMILALYVTWRRARQNVIRSSEAIGWSIVWIAAAIVVLLPDVTTRIAQVVGVGRGVDLVLYASVAILFLLIFKLFIQHEKLERKLTDAVRLEALRSASLANPKSQISNNKQVPNPNDQDSLAREHVNSPTDQNVHRISDNR